MLLTNSQMVCPVNRSILSPASPRSPLDMKFPSKRYGGIGIGLGIVAALEISSNQNPVCFFGSGLNRSDPVHCDRSDIYEEYTCVTRRDGTTKVYYNEDEFEFRKNRSDLDNDGMRLSKPVETSSHYLSRCCLCKKKLQGKDIYMYKGDEGFCSEVCRSVRIMDDNFKGRQEFTSVEVLRSRHTGGKVSSGGIFVI